MRSTGANTKPKSGLLLCHECGDQVFKKTESSRYLAVNCSVCHEWFCNRHIYYYADESNIAITNSARPKCSECIS